MANKVQGEGDYESARRYNERLTESVKKGKVKPTGTKVSEAEQRQAELVGKSRAKRPEQDAQDAELMDDYVKESKSKH